MIYILFYFDEGLTFYCVMFVGDDALSWHFRLCVALL